MPPSQPTSSLHTGDFAARFPAAAGLMQTAINDRIFPGASIGVRVKEEDFLGGFGHFTDSDSPAVRADTVFDLASLTKVMATTSLAMSLYEAGKLKLNAKLADILPGFAESEDNRRGDIVLRMLLAHCSGLPAHEKYFLRADDREGVLRQCLITPLIHVPLSRVEYSDVGFILLGAALEKLAGEHLETFFTREIAQALALESTRFNPPAALREKIPPTASSAPKRERIIQGEVHDDNAAAMGGVAPHAGLFAHAQDVLRFAAALLAPNRLFYPETVALFTARQSWPAGTSRALGWDTPSQPSQAGQHLSERAFGHLGYTGTSLWIDLEKQIAITLLTNRTWPDDSDHRIKQFRPRLHDAIVEAL